MLEVDTEGQLIFVEKWKTNLNYKTLCIKKSVRCNHSKLVIGICKWTILNFFNSKCELALSKTLQKTFRHNKSNVQ